MHIAWPARIIADSFQNVNLLDLGLMKRNRLLFLTLFLFLGIGAAPGLAQQADEVGPRLDLVKVDRSEFPMLGLHIIATDGQSRPLQELDALRLRENGVPIADFTQATVPAGIDVTFVLDIDQSSDTGAADEDGREPPLLQVVGDSLLRFSGRYMETGRDKASLLVPAATGGRWLVEGATDPERLLDAMTGYQPLSGQPQVLTMLDTVLERMEEQPDGDDLFRAIVLFTDGAGLNQFLFPPLVEQAQSLNVPIFVVLVGPEPSQERRDALSQLYEPVRGAYLRLTGADSTDDLYARIQANSMQNVVRYRSNLTTSGQYPIVVSLDGVRDEVTFDLELAPPQVDLRLTRTSVHRAGTRPDTPLEALQPTVLSVPVEITWPDGLPRSLAGATLRADGSPQTAPIVGTPESFTFEWDIAALDAGTYALTVQITDTVGLTARGGPVPVTVDVARPEPPPTATPPPPAVERALGTLRTRLEETGAPLPALAIAAAVLGLLVVAGIRLLRRTQPAPVAAPGNLNPDEAHEPTPGEEDGVAPVPAVLEVEEASPIEGYTIPLRQETITIGRDTRAARIALPDASVSRLHARIRWRNGAYWLYDEGSERGTYLNFDRLGLTPRPLHDGDEIQIGRVRLRFRLRPS